MKGTFSLLFAIVVSVAASAIAVIAGFPTLANFLMHITPNTIGAMSHGDQRQRRAGVTAQVLAGRR